MTIGGHLDQMVASEMYGELAAGNRQQVCRRVAAVMAVDIGWIVVLMAISRRCKTDAIGIREVCICIRHPPKVGEQCEHDQQAGDQCMRHNWLSCLKATLSATLRNIGIRRLVEFGGCARPSLAESRYVRRRPTRCNILAANEAYTRITGYQAQEVLGKNPRV